MRTMAIVNLKGGVGKTTTAVNLAYILAVEYGQRVLLIDADGQGNATQMLLPSDEGDGLAALLGGIASCWTEVVVPTAVNNLDILPADEGLWRLDLECMTVGQMVGVKPMIDLRKALEEDDAYDIVVIDCPPSFSAACVGAIAMADSIVIPVLPDAFSATGMDTLTEQIEGLKSIHPTVRIAGCLITQWHRADVVEDCGVIMRESAPVPVFDTVIRRTDKVLESTWASRPVAVWSPRSSAAKDYRAWVDELMGMEGVLHG